MSARGASGWDELTWSDTGARGEPKQRSGKQGTTVHAGEDRAGEGKKGSQWGEQKACRVTSGATVYLM